MTIQFNVYMNRTAYENDKVVFRRIINVPNGIKTPFESLIDNFKFLYGEQSFIEFTIE